MTYLLFKSLHIISVLLFASGMLVTPWLANGLCFRARDDNEQEFLRNLRSYHRWITSIAIVLVWVFGLGMAHTAKWWSLHWFHAKVFIALLLAAQHGAVSGRLRNLCKDSKRVYPPQRFPWFFLGMTIATVLVVIKPNF